jgi:outer membrane protein TolC
MPEIARAELDIVNADFNIMLAKSAYLPSLSAFARFIKNTF